MPTAAFQSEVVDTCDILSYIRVTECGIYPHLEPWAMIRECRDKRTADFLAGKRVKEFEACAPGAGRALTKLQAAVALYDLRHPPSNHFEALGDGRYSIRINRQWRVCFRWLPLADGDIGTTPGDAYDVEINNHYSR